MRIEITLAFLVIAGGCKKADDADRRIDTSVVAPPVAVSVPRDATSPADSGQDSLATCGVLSSTGLSNDGIGDLLVGKSVDETKRLCDVASDSPQRDAEGQMQRTLVVQLGGETILAAIVDNKVWRLDVRTPRFVTKDSLGVDTPLRRIAHMRGAQFAPGEDGVYGFVADHCGLSFRFSLPVRPPAGGQWTVAAIDKDHGDAAVDRVLVRKCGR